MLSNSGNRNFVQLVDNRTRPPGLLTSNAALRSDCRSSSALKRRPLLPLEKVGGSKMMVSNCSLRRARRGSISCTSVAMKRCALGSNPFNVKLKG